MKFGAVFLLSCLPLAVFSLAADRDNSNPVRRVVDLLQSLSEKLEKELKEETVLFKKYECWYKNVLATKTASNAAADARIDSLNSYIADIDAGKISFTTERADLELQIKNLQRELDTAEGVRKQEKEDFEAAKYEMEQAQAALASAISVMKNGTKGSFLTKKMNMLDVQDRLRSAVEISRSVLSASDANMMSRMLNNEVPEWDWKKLNRKATFKMKYTARSSSIIETLEKLEQTFTENLAEATQNEKESADAYDKLKASKEKMLGTAQQSLVDMVKENGARGLSKADAQAEIADLQAQVTADTKFMGQVEAAYQVKVKEWAARKELRDNEILACSKALAVLHSDDARDTFKESFKSQGYSFLQEHRCTKLQSRRVNALLQLAKVTKDSSVAGLVALARTGSIALVIQKVDELIASLDAEEETDLANKEKCEEDLATNAQEARMSSLHMDDNTEAIERAKSKVVELLGLMEEENAAIKATQDELDAATTQRSDETTKYAADKLQDEGAVKLLEMALAVMAKFKEGGGDVTAPTFLQLEQRPGLVSVNKHAFVQQPIEAGKAPPPPPATWDDPTYAGAEGETAGILGILEMIKDDVKKDIASADKAEADAQTAFEQQKKTMEDAIKASQDAIAVYEGQKGKQEQEITTKTTERASEKTILDGAVELYQNLRPGCDWIAINYDVRKRKRQVEIDGLKAAKAILQGADFPTFIQADHDC